MHCINPVNGSIVDGFYDQSKLLEESGQKIDYGITGYNVDEQTPKPMNKFRVAKINTMRLNDAGISTRSISKSPTLNL